MSVVQVELEAWDSWGTDDQNASATLNNSSANHAAPSSNNKQHGYQSNHFHRNKKTEPEPEPDIDYFEDMQPTLKKPTKVSVPCSKVQHTPVNQNPIHGLAYPMREE